MRNRLPMFLLLLICTAPAWAGESPATSQPQCVWTGVERIVAVGDIHGDVDQFVKVLHAAGIVNAKNDWIAGKTHLVQTGDVLDRGPDSRKAMDLLMKLEEQAPKTGGMVHPLIGNHEVMVPLGDLRYMTEEELASYGGEDGLRKLMSSDGKYGKWIRSHNAIIKINDVLFVHAGLAAADAKMTLEEINKAIRKDLADGSTEGLAMDSDGPLWTRGLAEGSPAIVAKKLDIILKGLGASRLVIGHTVATNGVLTFSDNRLIRIDVGMSACYKGPAACLEIDKGTFSEVRAGAKRRELFTVSADGSVKVPVPASQGENGS